MANESDKELTDAAKEAWELASFETEYVPVQTPPIRWSVEKYQTAQMLALSGKTKKQTAKELKLPISIIEAWLKNAEFNDYIDSLVEEYSKAMKNHRLKILNKILQARIDNAEVDGYADLSRKDTVDIISEIRKETGDDKVAENNYLGLLERLVHNSLKNERPVIQVGGEKS